MFSIRVRCLENSNITRTYQRFRIGQYMLQYPSINGVNKTPLGEPCVAFYKYDGSNLRFEWDKKKGWNKFGSRTQMIDSKTPILGEGIELFQDTMAHEIIYRIKDNEGKNFNNLQRITAFAEFYGENSFAGTHFEEDEKKLKLFDIFLFKKGFYLPKEFVNIFSGWEHRAEVVYEGNLNQLFIQAVRDNKLEGVNLFEGVICKGYSKKIKSQYHGDLWMCKIKTQQYLDRLKKVFYDDWEKFAE